MIKDDLLGILNSSLSTDLGDTSRLLSGGDGDESFSTDGVSCMGAAGGIWIGASASSMLARPADPGDW